VTDVPECAACGLPAQGNCAIHRDGFGEPDPVIVSLQAEVQRLTALLNTPQTADWAESVKIEAAHQRERWGSDHDAGKSPADWFWLIGYLAGKTLQAAVVGNTDKALHHTISAGAALANWHLALSGTDTRMRPGIEPPGGE
jgi:hypothetical protein